MMRKGKVKFTIAAAWTPWGVRPRMEWEEDYYEDEEGNRIYTKEEEKGIKALQYLKKHGARGLHLRVRKYGGEFFNLPVAIREEEKQKVWEVRALLKELQRTLVMGVELLDTHLFDFWGGVVLNPPEAR